MRFIPVLLAVMSAQVPDADPPIVGQPPAFSGIVGRAHLATSVEPKEAAVEEPLTFVVRILGETSAKYSPRRESLKIFGDDAEHDFWIEPLPDRDQSKPGVWEFAYRLKAKSVDVKETPVVKLVYYMPAAKKYQTTFGDRIPLRIRPRAETPMIAKEPQVLHAPRAILELSPRPATNGVGRPGPALWTVAWVGPPVLCLLAYVLRWLQPDALTQRRRAMHRAARHAVAELKHLPAHEAAKALGLFARYLSLRFGFVFGEWGPRDAETSLKRRGFSPEARRQCVNLLAAWDEHRFGPGHGSDLAWPARTLAAIQSLEEDPCTSR